MASEKSLRGLIVACGAKMEAANLGGGSVGDICARAGDSLLITPTGVPYPALRPPLIASMPLGGEYGAWKGPMKPTSEWRVHLDIARARPSVGAILRFQSPYATALAITGRPLPAAHPTVALFGGSIVRCTKYAPGGTKELAALALEGLGDGHAVLLGNMGALTTGATLAEAFLRAVELEALARLYAIAVSVGRPRLLADEEALRVVERLKAAGADIEARAAATAGEKAAPKRPPKGKLVARKRGSKKATRRRG